jgi:glutamate-1-semialdehyde 2,1-aminomutase
MKPINRSHLRELLEIEEAQYVTRNPESARLYQEAHNLFARVPMTWMNKWAGGFPLSFAAAHGAVIIDVDGHELIDFALGDTGAMAGHSPEALGAALAQRVVADGGVTTMMPTPDAQWVAAELTRRFGLEKWSFTLSATDANRWLLRLVRLVTGRSKILVFNYSYHGSVDESFVVMAPNGDATSRPGNVAPAFDPATSTRVVEFNDLDAVRAALAHGDVAAVLTEPALTNIGIVLPEPGFLEGLRQACDEAGSLLIIDETHTFSAGPGGATRSMGLRPDAITIGKSLGGGVPCGAYGLTSELADRVLEAVGSDADIVDVGGVGGTLAGNALSCAAMRAVLGQVLTDTAFEGMELLSTRFAEETRAAIAEFDLPWSVSQLGARCEYRFASPAPVNGGQSAASGDADLENFLHLYCLNRGVILTPFHNMALMCPETTPEQVARHGEVFRAALSALRQGG